MAGDDLRRLSRAERVSCTLCSADFPGSELLEHDASSEHRRNRGRFLVDRAIRLVDGYEGCPGPCGSMRGSPRLD